MAVAVVIALAIGLSVFEKDRAARPILTVSGIILTIPSYAVFAFLLPFTGLGFTSAVIVLIAYAQLPILRNTIIGLREIDPTIITVETRIPAIMTGSAIAAVIRAGGLGSSSLGGLPVPATTSC